MGLNVGSVYSYNAPKSIIDTQALTKVTEQILNPNNDKSIDVSKLDLSKFNRATIGTDFYALRTNGEIALKASKAAVDFDIKLSPEFMQNVQYLNSQAAQSLFTSKENNGKININLEITEIKTDSQEIQASSQIDETWDMNKDKRGSNPFSFYANIQKDEEVDDTELKTNSLSIFA